MLFQPQTYLDVPLPSRLGINYSSTYPFTVRRHVVVVVVAVRLLVCPPSFRLSATGWRGSGTSRGRGSHVGDRGHATAAVTRRGIIGVGGGRGRHGVSLLGPDGHFEFLFDQQTGADVLHPWRGHRRTGGTGRVFGRGRAVRVMAFERVHYVHDRVDHVGRV